MNALVQTIEHFETGYRLPAGIRKALHSLGIRLSALGQHEQALPATQEAVDIYRQLVQVR